MVEKEIIINGHKVRYGEKEHADASTVYVFLHGWGSDYAIFKSLFTLVNCAIALDFPGFGGSQPLKKPWTLAKYAATTREFLEKKIGDRKVIFIAHSFGGRVLLQMLSQQSKIAWVQQVICIGIPFVRKQRTKQSSTQTLLHMAKGVTQMLPKPAREKVLKWGYSAVGSEDYAALTTDTMRKTFQHIINTDMEYLAQSLHNYTTIFIWGTHDTAAPIEDAETIARKVNATIYRIEEGDHFPFLGNTEDEFKTVFKKSIAL